MTTKNTRHPRRVQVIGAERKGTSAMGNPRFHVGFSDGTMAMVQTDSSIVYDVENVKRSGEYVVPFFTPAGRVAYWEKAPEPTLAERMDDEIAAGSSIDRTDTTRLVRLAANWTRVYLPGGGTIWFSYEEPVAAAMPGYGTARTAQKFSQTTSKHLGSDPQTNGAQTLTREQFATFLGSVVR